MNTKKISLSLITQAVLSEAKVIKRKEEIFNTLKSLNEEAGKLSEQGMIGTFGFKVDGDVSAKTKTGFENSFQSFSHLSQLEKEFTEKQEEEKGLNEINKSLKEENERLRKELENLKK